MSREQSQSSFSTDDMEELRKEASSRKSLSFIEDDKLQPFHDYLWELKEKFLEDDEYIEAKDASELMERCKIEIQHRSSNSNSMGSRSQSKANDSVTNQMVQEYSKKIQEHDETTKQKYSKLQEKHKHELEEFEKEWEENMPDKYRRPSRKLIELRQTAHNLALCGNFDEAQERKVEAENLEIKETEEAQKRLNKEYSIAKNKLIRKQAEEVRAFQENAQQQRDILISKKHVAEQASNNRKNVLNLKPSQKSRLTSSLRSSGSPTRPIVTRRSHNRNIEKKLPPLRPPKEEAQQNNKTNSQFKDPKKQQKHKPIEEEHTNMESDKKDEELELKPLVIETNQNENEENENESNNEQEVQTPKSESE